VDATARKNPHYLIGAAGVVLVKKIHFMELDQHHPVRANFGSRSHPSSAEEGIFRTPCDSFTPMTVRLSFMGREPVANKTAALPRLKMSFNFPDTTFLSFSQ
jgi:hypothetical protein